MPAPPGIVPKKYRRARLIPANIYRSIGQGGGATAAGAMRPRERMLDPIRRLALQGMGERRTDGELLEHFISRRDEGAFALLLRRHSAMVWSVCRRILGNAHDADDAFQAAFLVLVRKADSVRPREAVGKWLYGVAYRTALEARSRIARRRVKELPLHDMPSPQTNPEQPGQELGPILDRELSRLADKYRLPIVLCDLEGRSRKEVAHQLAIPEGTLSSRLATARKKLAKRLARLGFAVSAAALGMLLMEKTAMASPSLSLLSSTTKAALSVATGPTAAAGIVSTTVSSLTEGVIKTMFLAKIKTTALVLCGIAALGLGTGGVYYQTRVRADDSPRETQKADQKPSSNAAREPGRSADEWKRIAEDLQKQLIAERDKAKVQELELRSLQEALARQQSSPVPAGPIAAFEKMRAEQEQRINEHRKRVDAIRKKHQELLDMHLQQFEKEMQQNLAAADKMNEKIRAEQAANQPSAGSSQKPASGDKLDRILELLERVEKRLDRLEKGKR